MQGYEVARFVTGQKGLDSESVCFLICVRVRVNFLSGGLSVHFLASIFAILTGSDNIFEDGPSSNIDFQIFATLRECVEVWLWPIRTCARPPGICRVREFGIRFRRDQFEGAFGQRIMRSA